MKIKYLFLIAIFGLLAFFQVQNAFAATAGACAGSSTTTAGTCKPTGSCAASEITDGTCTAASGTSYANMDCCIASNNATPGSCSGSSTNAAGSCKSTGSCTATTEKADGTCTAQSGAAYLYMDCCVAASATATGGGSGTGAGAGAGAGGGSTVSGGTEFVNPLKFKTVEELLINILSTMQMIIVTLALVAMVIGAVLYVTSAGVEKQVTQAKEAIGAAMIGLALGIAAPSLLKEISTILGWTPKSDTPNSDTLNNALTLSQIAINILNFLLGVFGVLSLIMMVVGAALYLTSAGDKDRIDKVKDIFKFSVLGIIIAMAAMVLVRQIASFFVAA